ncbi:MAG: DeoR/GlpR family DNA-binding transcription regulator [Treponema sp.]|nr:DeoR/GlpR family DNA-binding transcription regulator [Treponema sp.]
MERREKITTFLKSSNVLSIKALSELLKVSTMTVRRDLETLAKEGIVQFYHGGVIFNPTFLKQESNPNDYFLQGQTMLHRDEKTAIARKAIELPHSQETIMFDSGTTVYYLARELSDTINLTAFVWSLNIIEELIHKPQINILMQGGVYHPETQMFESTQSQDIIKNSRASKAFISAGGFHKSLGITCPFHYEVETKRTAIKHSMTNILLIDSSKFGKVCPAHMAETADFQVIITDPGIPEEYEDFIRSSGLELIVA